MSYNSTLNEENNIHKIYKKILNTKIKLDIIFVDDNSTDKTRLIIKKLSNKNKNVKFIFRNNKKGIVLLIKMLLNMLTKIIIV